MTPTTPYISMFSGEASLGGNVTKETAHIENGTATSENKTVKNAGEIYEVHRVSTEPILCPCRKQESGIKTPFQSSPMQSDNSVRQSISFIEYSTGQENRSTFRNSISFNDQTYFDRQSLFSSDQPPESTNRLIKDHSNFENSSTNTEKVNETEKTALSEFMKDSKQFRNQLKTRIRNSVSFSSSQNSNCSDQLENQCKHSISYTEQIDKAIAFMDEHRNRTNLKQHQHSSCFAIGSLHHSIPELIKLSDDKVTSKSFIGNSHQNQRTDRDNGELCHGQSIALSQDSLAGNLLDTSGIRLTNPSPIQEDYNKASSHSNLSEHKTDLGLYNDTNTCHQATNTCSTWTGLSLQEPADVMHAENLKTKIFFINDRDDEDCVEIS